MTRVVMEHVEYELNVPETGVQPDSLTFVEIDQEKCIGCDTCQQYCPTGAIYGETFEPHTIKYRELCINCGQCLTHILRWRYTRFDHGSPNWKKSSRTAT